MGTGKTQGPHVPFKEVTKRARSQNVSVHVFQASYARVTHASYTPTGFPCRIENGYRYEELLSSTNSFRAGHDIQIMFPSKQRPREGFTYCALEKTYTLAHEKAIETGSTCCDQVQSTRFRQYQSTLTEMFHISLTEQQVEVMKCCLKKLEKHRERSPSKNDVRKVVRYTRFFLRQLNQVCFVSAACSLLLCLTSAPRPLRLYQRVQYHAQQWSLERRIRPLRLV